MIVIGINAFHGDGAVAAVVGGQFVTGVEEERFTRVKHWAGFPLQALRHCLLEVNGLCLRSSAPAFDCHPSDRRSES